MNFDNFISNLHIKKQIISLFRQNKMPHAIIIEGEKGLGKKTFADIIAQTVVCSNLSNGLACGHCVNCQKMSKNIHPDVIYPEKSGVLQAYNVATVRKIRADAFVVPNEAATKVYILSDIDNMGIPAQNALLKVLEEPPKNVIFILTCVNSANVLPTIRSRTLQFALKPVSQTELRDYLEAKFQGKNLENVLEVANGNIGLALDLMASSAGKKVVDIAREIALSLVKQKEFDTLKLLAQVSENRKDFLSLLRFLSAIFRDALVLAAKCSVEKNNNCAKILSEKLSVKQILALINFTNKTENFVEKNINISILTTCFCSNLFSIANEN